MILIYRGSPPPVVYRDLSYPDRLLSLIGDPILLGAFSGFVYLLDQQQRVRWAGGGLALPEETDSLMSCTGVLLHRYKQKLVRPAK